ncbi:unnamed protein product [Moneuplotes crassus]|uniref:Calmodulin n=2 Tax=Euplotes crassus TaxID=5936 RepID=A0AAD1Y0Y5_EUPCR|nr:unnamed protein product [Moneuplotes crassus]
MNDKIDNIDLTPAQIAEFKEAFSLFDHDENGSVSISELGDVLRALGQNPTDNELRDMVNEIDEDGNGTIEFMEFLILLTSKSKEMSQEEEITEAFKILDRERDDYVSLKEIKFFMRKVAHIKLSNAEAEAMLNYADSDGDGMVTFEDFRQLAKKLYFEKV